MRQHTQTIVAGHPDGIPGNCLQAAIASLLDRPMEAVPHFVLFDDWKLALRLWAQGEGLTARWEKRSTIPDEPAVVCGWSPRGFGHATVGSDGAIVWDPHPDRTGLTSITDVLVLEAAS